MDRQDLVRPTLWREWKIPLLIIRITFVPRFEMRQG
jgi:hypothetical protein